MSKKGTAEARPVRGWVLPLLAVLAAGSTLWAIFLWSELIAARTTGTLPTCVFGAPGSCGALWDGAFAAAVHAQSGLPVAGWGLVWGLVAFALPMVLIGLHGQSRAAAVVGTALQLTAGAGAVGVLALAAVATAAGLFCSSCAVTYLLTLGYAGVAFFTLKPPRWRWPAGAGLAAGLTAVVFALVAGLGPRTPASVGGGELLGTGRTGSNPELDSRLTAYLASLPEEARGILSRVLVLYRQAPATPPETPRAAVGPASAPVLITDFTDVLCSHCAELHEALTALRQMVPEQIRIDSRHFPLDGHCNARLAIRGEEVRVSCLAAQAQICLESSEHRFEYAGELFRNQAGLTAEQVYQLAAPYLPREALAACVASPETAARLAADVEYAWRFKPRGTPLVLVNGREAPAFAPFLLALALAGGNTDHPAFATLPPPDFSGGS